LDEYAADLNSISQRAKEMSEMTITGCEDLVKSGKPDLYALAIAAMDRALLTAALAHFNGNQTQVCEALGIARLTLRNKLKGLGIRASDYLPKPDSTI
jgi:DNA-binding protein Fis